MMAASGRCCRNMEATGAKIKKTKEGKQCLGSTGEQTENSVRPSASTEDAALTALTHPRKECGTLGRCPERVEVLILPRNFFNENDERSRRKRGDRNDRSTPVHKSQGNHGIGGGRSLIDQRLSKGTKCLRHNVVVRDRTPANMSH